MRYISFLSLILSLFLSPTFAYASPAHASLFTPSMSWAWCIPFVALLLSIALLPLLFPVVWHHHFGKITGAWIASLFIPLLYYFDSKAVGLAVLSMLLHEYLPLLILLFTLYVVSSGIHVHMHRYGTPVRNTLFLALGTVLASFISTIGASIVLARPLLQMNRLRHKQAHIVVFFIFLVANIGGCLTPLGDPPLFIGYLQGVDFFWPMKFLWKPFLCVVIPLLTLFYVIDTWFYRKEDHNAWPIIPHQQSWTLTGKFYVVLFVGIIATLFSSGLLHSSHMLQIAGIALSPVAVFRDLTLCLIAATAFIFIRSPKVQSALFHWEPIQEVAILFLGLFFTLIPTLALLHFATQSSDSALIQWLHHTDGTALSSHYFWLTGIFSSLLDNVPTYLIFFNLAGGDAELLMNQFPKVLMAISMGAVFMGANTYIGNAPNLMVRAIAAHQGLKMPSFFGFMGYALVCLVPLWVVVCSLFLRA